MGDPIRLEWNDGDLQERLKAAPPSLLVQFLNCKVLRNHCITKEDLWIRDGRIVNPERIFFVERRLPDICVDCDGHLIVPGFIDIQINGGFGVDFSSDVDNENLEQNFLKVASGLLRHGVTSFCPTIISSKRDIYHKMLPYLIRSEGTYQRAGNLGAHLEGPFINDEKRGAHPAANIQSMVGADALEDMYGTDNLRNSVRIVTLAAELPGALVAIQRLTERYHIAVSLGHSKSSIVEAERGINAGASAITHVFNAMDSYHHRDPGLIGLLTSKFLPSDRKLFYGIISDGIHTHDSALRMAHKTHPEGLILITDAIAALGLGDGMHKLGDSIVEVHGKKAVLAHEATVAGSVSSMDTCVRHLVKAARCSIVDALECATLHPAQFLRIVDRKGTLDFGSDADFLLLDKNLNVHATFVAGCPARLWTANG